MSKTLPTLPPELVALVDAGDGFAEFVDPNTNRVFSVTAERAPHPCAHPETEEELRAALDEARESLRRDGPCTMTTEEILAEARRRAGIDG